MNNLDQNLGLNIRYLRAVYHVSIEQLAREIGVSKKVLLKVQSGKPSPYFTASHLKRLSNYFHISSDILLFEHPNLFLN